MTRETLLRTRLSMLASLCWLLAGCAAGYGSRPVLTDVEIALDEPTSARPVSAGVGVTPREASPGDTVTVVIHARTASGWHIYSVDGPTGVSVPTTLKLDLPAGWQALGAWSLPDAEPYISVGLEGTVYQGDFLFSRRVRIPGSARPGPARLRCTFGYQACDPVRCLQPQVKELTATVQIVPAP